MKDSNWTSPPALNDVDILLLKMQQQEKPVLTFQFTLNGMPWRVTLEKKEDGSAHVSMMLELAALPFSAEANQRRLASTTLIHLLNTHWAQRGQDIRLGLSPRRNTLFLVQKIACPTTPGLCELLTVLAQHVVALQGSLRILKTCTPWLLAPYGNRSIHPYPRLKR